MRVTDSRGVRRRLLGGLGLVSATMLAAATIALAAKPAAGKTYHGHVTGQSTEQVSFKVSGTGKWVRKLTVPAPLACQGGGIQSPSPQSAKIKHGAFKKTFLLTFGGGSPGSGGTETVTGRFVKGGKEKGTISTRFKKLPSSCDATVKYTTHD